MATPVLILRIVQAVVAVVVLGLAAEGVSAIPFSELEFLLFCSIFAILSLVYLILASFVNGISHIYITLGLNALNTVFFFAGFIAVAAVADVLNCEDLDFTYYYGFVTPCQCIQASSGIGALSWLLWMATLIIGGRDAYLNRSQSPAPQGAAVAGPSFKETANDTVNAPQMSDPDI